MDMRRRRRKHPGRAQAMAHRTPTRRIPVSASVQVMMGRKF
jgi:hypothetical protein